MKEIDPSKIRNLSDIVFNKKNNTLSTHIKIKDILFRKDGSVNVVAENSYSVLAAGTAGSVKSAYFTNDNIVISLDQKSGVKWVVSVPKRQETNVTDMLGAKALLKDDNLFLIYNEVPSNLEKESDGSPKAFGGWAVKSVIAIALEK